MFEKIKSNAKFKNTVHKTTKVGKSALLNVVLLIILAGTSYVILSPLIGMVSEAFKSSRDIYNPLVYLFPRAPTLENFVMAIRYMQFTQTFPKTFIYALGETLLQVAVTSFVGYGFARFNFPGKKIWFALVIATIVVPQQALMSSIYTQFQGFDPLGIVTAITGKPANLLDTFVPMTLMTALGMGLRSGLYIFIFRQFFRGLPKEIEEAAFIDGAGTFYTFLRVMLPNAVPSILTVFLFSLVWQYNDTYFASMLMSRMSLMSVKLSSVGGSYSNAEKVIDPNLIRVVTNAAILLGITPIIAIYAVLQRHFMEGIERSGIVG